MSCSSAAGGFDKVLKKVVLLDFLASLAITNHLSVFKIRRNAWIGAENDFFIKFTPRMRLSGLYTSTRY